MPIKYFMPYRTEQGYVLSVDNVRINFEVNAHYKTELESFLNDSRNIHIKQYPIDLRDFRYKYLYNFSYCDNILKNEFSMTLGYIFNGTNVHVDIYKGFLDYNPNKLGDIKQFWNDLNYIKSCCAAWDIARCDIALDIPAKREYVILEKDNRVYECKAYSFQNMTECLGLRSHIGRVKVYNKTLESDLDYDLTRIEVTCLFNSTSYFNNFPKIWNITNDIQLSTDILELNDSDLAILRMALECMRSHNDNGLMIFNSMGRKKKQKLKKYLLPESCLVVPSANDVNKIINALGAYIK